MKKTNFIILVLLAISLQMNAQIWNQIDSIIGESNGDYLGKVIDINGNGDIIAIGIPNADGSVSNSGKVQVYQNISGNWVQMGSDINGEATGDYFGHKVSMSMNGDLLAISAPYNEDNASDAGKVQLYSYSGGNWVFVTEFLGDNDDHLGMGIALSGNGLVLAIGAYTNDDAFSNAGKVQIYKNISGTWTFDEGIFGYESRFR